MELDEIFEELEDLPLEELSQVIRRAQEIRERKATRKMWTMYAGQRVKWIGKPYPRWNLHHGSLGTIAKVNRKRVQVTFDDWRFGVINCPPTWLELVETPVSTPTPFGIVKNEVIEAIKESSPCVHANRHHLLPGKDLCIDCKQLVPV